jgi:hypothetical protein
MLSGRRYKLEREILAVDIVDSKRRAVTIPAGTIFKVVSGPVNGDGLVNILWNGRVVEMFLVDVEARGTEIKDDRAQA